MMKQSIYFFAIFLLYTSCKQMDSEYKDFVVPNGLTYPQKADSLQAFAGFNKLRLKWLKPKSPTVKYAYVYWNNYRDSLKIDFLDNQDTISVDIMDLEETSYSFYIKNYDQDGNASIPVEITATPYGENYLVSAADRQYGSALRNDQKTGTITWNVKTPDLVHTEIRYTAGDGSLKTVLVEPAAMLTSLPDIMPGKTFEYRSVFLPAKGLDQVARAWKTSDSPFLYRYPRTNWTAAARNGNHDWGDGGGGQAYLLLDGKINTGWHSKVGAPLPQTVQFDMQVNQLLYQLILYPPSTISWRYLNKLDVYLSQTGFVGDEPIESWGKPITRVTYSGGDNFKINLEKPATARYVALVFTDSKNGTFISFMEFEAYGI